MYTQLMWQGRVRYHMGPHHYQYQGIRNQDYCNDEWLPRLVVSLIVDGDSVEAAAAARRCARCFIKRRLLQSQRIEFKGRAREKKTFGAVIRLVHLGIPKGAKGSTWG